MAKFFSHLLVVAVGLALAIALMALVAIMPAKAAATPLISSAPVQQIVSPTHRTTQAMPLTPTSALERLFQTETAQADWFTTAFLQQVPIEQVRTLLSQLKQSLGALHGVTPLGDGYQLTFARGTVPAKIQLNGQGQIAGLFFGPPTAPLSLSEAVQAFQALDGNASLLILQGEEVLAAVEADQPLAVGSAFKLAVLAALRQAIVRGALRWDTVVTLQPEWRSLPSGMIQDWPVGTAVTLETLAALMISVSDNTATDALIHTLGRSPIEALTPRNQPFLTTREFFMLKDPRHVETLRDFRQADPTARRQVLETLATADLPNASLFTGDPLALDVEWYFSARELCGLMVQVKDLPLMGINPGLAQPQDWSRIAFKGGSEPGVFNLTTWLESNAGKSYCVVATWNHPNQRLNETDLIKTYSSILAELGRQSAS